MPGAIAEITTAKDMKILIYSYYRPPDADKTRINKFESFLQDVCKCHSKIMITGDFNFPRASWNSRENAIDGNENSLVKLLNDFFVERLIKHNFHQRRKHSRSCNHQRS